MKLNANHKTTTARFKIRSVFLFVNLTVLFLPIFGIIFFRFYENQLVKQTETELISQAAILAATYKEYLRDQGINNESNYGSLIKEQQPETTEEYYTPIIPEADLFAGDIFPPRPDGIITDDLSNDLQIVAQGKTNSEDKEISIAGLSSEPAEVVPAMPSETISVVGSRVKGRTAMDSKVPEDVLTAKDLKETPPLSLMDRNTGSPDLEFAADAMLPIIIEAQKTTLAGIKILNHQGTVIAGRNEVGLNFSHLDEIKIAMTGQYNSLLRERISDEPMPAIASISRGTGVRLFSAFPIVENDRLWGIVYLSRTPQNILKHIYDNRSNMSVIALSLIILTLLLAWLTSYTISNPINRLISRIQRFTEGEVAAIEPMTSPGVKEIEQLSKSFSKMAHTINNRSQYIRDFAMSVSHEFKTPITSIQGSAELLIEHIDDMEAEKKNKFLENIISDSDRLSRLIKRLLELAKADSFVPENESCPIIQVIERLKIRYADLNLNIQFEYDDNPSVLMACEHIETIFSNLFDNALQNDADKVSLEFNVRYGFITVYVKDNGSGISEANKSKIFTSFFTTKREEGGTGLGLDIVSSLLVAHNGDISLKDGNDDTTFIVTIPAVITE